MRKIPRQFKGARSFTSYSIVLPSVSSAKISFENARKNLLNVNAWHIIAGPGSAAFEIINNKGEKIDGFVQKGNYLRISIPNIPGSPVGKGADWVRVEKIIEEENKDHQSIAITVRPASAPVDDKPEAAHFFDEDATSTFIVERRDRKLIAAVNGRNETPNTKTNNIVAWFRNLFIAIGAMIGFNKPQWKGLVKGLLTKNYSDTHGVK